MFKKIGGFFSSNIIMLHEGLVTIILYCFINFLGAVSMEELAYLFEKTILNNKNFNKY